MPSIGPLPLGARKIMRAPCAHLTHEGSNIDTETPTEENRLPGAKSVDRHRAEVAQSILANDILDNFPMDIGQTEIAALIAIG